MLVLLWSSQSQDNLLFFQSNDLDVQSSAVLICCVSVQDTLSALLQSTQLGINEYRLGAAT